MIKNCCVSVFGGITPDKLRGYLHRTLTGAYGDDGLFQRLQVLVWPDRPVGQINDIPIDKAAARAKELFQRLSDLGVEREHAISFDSMAQEAFLEWYNAHLKRLETDDHPPALASHLSKYPSLLPSLALIFQLVENGGTLSPIGQHAFDVAAAWYEFLETHANRIYQSGFSPEVTVARNMVTKIKRDTIPDPFRPWQLVQMGIGQTSRRLERL